MDYRDWLNQQIDAWLRKGNKITVLPGRNGFAPAPESEEEKLIPVDMESLTDD